MSMLQIYIPDGWVESEGTPACPWVLRNAQPQKLREGVDSLSQLPGGVFLQVVLPASRVLFAEVDLPTRNRHKLSKALPFAVEDLSGAEPESLHVAMGERLTNGRTAVAVVDKTWFARLLSLIKKQGLNPRTIIAETQVPILPASSWVVVWQAGASFVRTGEASGLSIDVAGANDVPLTLKLALNEARKRQAQPQQLWIRSLDHASLDVAYWSQDLELPVREGAPWDWSEQVSAKPPVINLMQGEFMARRGLHTLLPQLKPALYLGLLIITLQLGASFIDWLMLTREKSRLTQAMQTEFRTAFPEAKAIVNPALQMRRNLIELRAAAGIASEEDFLPLLARIAAQLTPNARVQKLSYSAGTLHLDMQFAQAEDAPVLLKKFLSEGLNATLETTQQGMNLVRYRVQAKTE